QELQHQSSILNFYNKASKQRGVGWNLTLGLYWICPFFYLNLDIRNRSYLLQYGTSYYSSIAQISNLKQPPNAPSVLVGKGYPNGESLSLIKWICFELTTAFDISRVVTGTIARGGVFLPELAIALSCSFMSILPFII
ncbi:MAG: hypothetical protein PHS89_10535, partial [Syntrophaceticus schinkii]|nr:hypothetical protein [Syntrophaceticus schinkii]